MDEFGVDCCSPSPARAAEDEFALALDSADEAPPLPRVVRHRRARSDVGPAFLVIITSSESGWWSSAPPAPGHAHRDVGDGAVIGAVIARWRLATSEAAAAHTEASPEGTWLLGQLALRGTRASQAAYLLYESLAGIRLLEPYVPSALASGEPVALKHEVNERASTSGEVLADVLERWGTRLSTEVSVLALSAWLAFHSTRDGEHERGSFFHGAVVGRRLQQGGLLRSVPGRRALQAFRRDVLRLPVPAVAQGQRQRRSTCRAGRGWLHQHRADLIVDWLDCARFMKDNSKTIVACDAFARLFSRGLAATREEIMTNLQRIGKEVLRKAQVRLDMVAMLITRRWLEACVVDYESMNLFSVRRWLASVARP